MKTYSKSLSTAFAVAFLLVAGSALTQYQAIAADGITASPKLRQTLDAHRTSALPSQPEMAKMGCAKCVDTVTTAIDYTARGANKTVTVIKHGCNDCNHSLATTGVGKAATTTAVHQCGNSTTLACCNSAKN